MTAHDKLASMGNVLYLCDGKACDGVAMNCGPRGMGECWHTNDIGHALHKEFDFNEFVPLSSRAEGRVDLWEPNDD